MNEKFAFLKSYLKRVKDQILGKRPEKQKTAINSSCKSENKCQFHSTLKLAKEFLAWQDKRNGPNQAQANIGYNKLPV